MKEEPMSRKLMAILALIVVASLLLGACAPAATPEPTKPPPTKAPEPTEPPPPEEKPLGLPGAMAGKTWDDILAEADGQEVTWWMWGGSSTTNEWVNGWLADKLKENFNITMKQVPVAGPTEFINQVMGEKTAGQDTGGAVDFMWINGENFRTMKEAGLLYGPWSQTVPSGQYYDWDDASVAYDFGYAVEGYEIPWGSAASAAVYDSERLPDPPRTSDAFVQWIKDNPGRFTYGALPGFNGSMTVRFLCYYAMGGYEDFLVEFDQALFDERFPACWDFLNEIEPFLWRGGETYPQDGDMQTLFNNGEIDMYMAYGLNAIRSQVEEGLFPDSARPLMFEDGMIGNTHYTAIAYNAANLAAALVTTNFVAGLESQFYLMDAWDRRVPWKMENLPKEYQDKVAEMEAELGVYTLRDAVMPPALPELQSPWLIAIEEAWEAEVLRK
jgi:putative spermidine/putrescine transport system substrate-binding protein